MTRAAPAPPPAATGSALPLRRGGPTLIVGVGARIDSVDPGNGSVIGSIAPIAIANFTWQRFLRRGKFLLAEGRTEWVQAPVWHSTRGLVLLDETGGVRWIETHAVSLNRASRAVFLDGDGNVAFDRIDKPTLIKPDGARIEIGAPPAGPVVHGPPDVLPVRSLCSGRVERWLGVATSRALDAPPAEIARRLLLRPTLDERLLALVQVVDVAPEDEIHTPEVKTVARMPLPQACRGKRQWVSPTMSSRHWIIGCAPEWDDDVRRRQPTVLFVIDVEARRLRRVTPPPSDQSGVPRDVRQPDEIQATVMADGTIVATVWSSCITSVYLSTPGGGWKRSNIATPFGPPFAPKLVCGRLILEPTLMPSNMGCGGDRTGPATFVRRPDGSWLTLPYVIAAHRSGSCSSDDAEVVAFVADGALTTARLDRDERKIVRAGVAKELPLAWLP